MHVHAFAWLWAEGGVDGGQDAVCLYIWGPLFRTLSAPLQVQRLHLPGLLPRTCSWLAAVRQPKPPPQALSCILAARSRT